MISTDISSSSQYVRMHRVLSIEGAAYHSNPPTNVGHPIHNAVTCSTNT